MPKSIKPKRKEPLYYGYWIFAICFIDNMFILTQTVLFPGLFITHIAEDLALSRSAVTLTITLISIGTILSMLVAGKIMQQISLRIVMPIGLAVFAACVILQSFAETIEQLYIISVVRGLAGPFVTTLVTSIALNNWFGRRMIGKMISFSMIGYGIGGIILNPIVGRMIETLGWRTCYRALGALPLLLIPVILLFLSSKPEDKGLRRLGDLPGDDAIPFDTPPEGFSSRQAIKTGAFWFSGLVVLAWNGVTQAWYTVAPPYLTDTGMSAVAVASAISFTAGGNILGKLFFGPFFDRFRAKKSIMTGLAIGTLALVSLLLGGGVPAVTYFSAALIGFAVASCGLAAPILAVELFGRKDYGVINGYLQLLGNVGNCLIPVCMAFVAEQSGSYVLSWTLLSLLMLLGILLLFPAYRKISAAKKQP